MGNTESHRPGERPGEDPRLHSESTEMRRCYYDILEVERSDTTTTEDIKKAYRRLALRYHPDKNHEDPKSAAEKFIEIQSAYEVLSDEQERAWYDSHREQILRGVDGENVDEDRAVVGITVADLMKYFDSSTFAYMNDSPKGFFTIIRTLFTTLDREEEAAAREAGEDYTPLPSFGDSRSDPKSDVRQFYSRWMGFATMKSFSWKDQWKYSDAPDRRVKRAMEKENKRLRDAGRREFNDTVKSLVMFIRKRDPRYVKETIDEAKLQASLLAASKSQAARAKSNFQESLKDFHLQSWMQVEEEADEDLEDDESEVEEQYECIACKKIYKNQRQFDAHLKGKKHLKATQTLRRAMRMEDETFNVSDGLSTQGTATPVAEPHGSENRSTNMENDLNGEGHNCGDQRQENVASRNSDPQSALEVEETQEPAPPPDSTKSESDTEASVDSDKELEQELADLLIGSGKGKKGREETSHDGQKKIGAAKAKRQKKAEKLAALEAEGKAPAKPRKGQKLYDSTVAMQKARGETAKTGKKASKRK